MWLRRLATFQLGLAAGLLIALILCRQRRPPGPVAPERPATSAAPAPPPAPPTTLAARPVVPPPPPAPPASGPGRGAAVPEVAVPWMARGVDDPAGRALLAGAAAAEAAWTDRQAVLTMRIVTRAGEYTRVLSIWNRRDAERQRTVVLQTSPADGAGTGFLSDIRANAPADRWVYLPEFRRIRHIGEQILGESFFGTDFSFGDLDLIAWPTRRAGAATCRLLGAAEAGGVDTDAVAVFPRDDPLYAAIVFWIARDDLVPRRIEFHDHSRALVKRFSQSDVVTVDGIPVAHHGEIENAERGTRTVVDVTDVHFDIGIPEDVFTVASLVQAGHTLPP